ncbi:MAG: hypothetical protein KDF60_17935 [Calditrichaeota bacterium]|nr:hypothetical protein [Calditrichota bacterium]
MSSSCEIIIVLIYLSGRLFFYDMDNILGTAKRKGFIKRLLYGLIALLMLENLVSALLLYVVHTLLVLFDTFVLTRKKEHKLRFYLLHLFLALFFSQLVLSLFDFSDFLIYNPFLVVSGSIAGNLPFLAYFKSPEKTDLLLQVLTGFIFTIKEGTIIIRLVLDRMSATPKQKEAPTRRDKKEYDRGKLIGILERGLIFMLIIFNQVGAVAIIIALKSLARFKELDDKNFAEYFLIGSLLSISVAVIPAALIRIFQ